MTALPGLGHNNGPSLDEGAAFRTHAWRRAREDLLPTLPIEVVRLRVARARELGLDYRTYAGVRASTGRDVVGFLFSTNALGLLRPTDALPRDRRDRLAALVGCDRTAAVQPPLDARRVLALAPLDAAHPAPAATLPWPAMRDAVRAILRARGLPPDAVLLVGETAAEREWVEAGRMAGFLSGERAFAPLP
jgi:hypothetical protein